MPTFTVELRTLVEDGHDIGLSDYPIFREEYREKLNKKIIDHYWLDEIGLETHIMFAHQMRVKMNEIMPYYNKLYETELVKVDPFLTMELIGENSTANTVSSETNATSASESDSTTGSESRAVNHMFPQARLAGNEDYATSATDTGSKSSGRNTNSGTSGERATGQGESRGSTRQTVYSGNRSQQMADYRMILLNIDVMIIEELSELFMGVWNNGDSYSAIPWRGL